MNRAAKRILLRLVRDFPGRPSDDVTSSNPFSINTMDSSFANETLAPADAAVPPMTMLSPAPELNAELRPQIATLDGEVWHRILDLFQDASPFQTPAFCIASAKSEKMEHLVLRRGEDVVAAAQVRLVRVPLSGLTIAYVFWGPMFHRWERDPDWTALGQALALLREEYVVRRRFSLRIVPIFSLDADNPWKALLVREGYEPSPSETTKRTIILNLEPPLEDIRKNLDKKWRNCLNSAERNGLELREGSDDAMFELFDVLFREMVARKRLADPGDIRRFRAMQAILPERCKTTVVVALENGTPCGGAIFSSMGRRGLYLFGATADPGLKNKASYLVQWRMVTLLKERGCLEYDLHGSNAEVNPGVYAFKIGLCGKNGAEIESVGNHEMHSSPRSRSMMKLAERANAKLKQLKAAYRNYRDKRA